MNKSLKKVTKKRIKTFTKRKPLIRNKLITSKNFERNIIDEYEHSGIGINNISINIGNYKEIPRNVLIPNGYDLYSINIRIRQFIANEIMNRMQEPIYDILRSIKNLCYPHIYFNYNDINIDKVTRNSLLKKIIDGKKWTPSEKKKATNDLSLAYAISRCYNEGNSEYKIIVIPIGVSSSKNGQVDHSNILIIDLRQNSVMDMKDNIFKLKYMSLGHQEKFIKNSSQKFLKNKKNDIAAYLFEPNGIQFSKDNGINTVVFNYIKQANSLLKNMNLNIQISKFEVVGGDGIQTILGKKFRNLKQKTIGHSGYPICAGIGFWIVFKWMKRHFLDISLPFYINTLIDAFKENQYKRYEDKENLKKFLENIRKYTENNYSSKMKDIVEKQLKSYLRNDYYLSNFIQKNNSNFDLGYIYNLKGNINSKFSYKGLICINFSNKKFKISKNIKL